MANDVGASSGLVETPHRAICVTALGMYRMGHLLLHPAQEDDGVMTDYLQSALITEEVVAGRPATVAWDSALLSALPDEVGRQEIIRLIALAEQPHETRDFFVCFRKNETGFDWLRCVSGFSGRTGLRHFSLTFTEDSSEPLDVEGFCRWCADVAGCEPEISDRLLSRYRRYLEKQKEAKP